MTGAGEDSVSTSLSTPKPHQQHHHHHHHHHLSLKSLRASNAYIPAKNDFSYVPCTAEDTPPDQAGRKGPHRQAKGPAERSWKQRGKEASKASRRKHSNVVRSYSCECVRAREEEEEEDEEEVEEEEEVVGPQGDAGGAGLSIPAAPGADGRVCSKGSAAPRSNPLPQECAHTTPQHGHGGSHSCGNLVQRSLRVNLKECGLFCDEKQKVQRVVKVGGGEIQVEVISSELVVKREPRESCGDGTGVVSGGDTSDERPAKKKRKFIIILKGLLNKSKRSEKKKCVEGESGRASVGGGESEAVTNTNGKNNNKRDVKCGVGDGRGEAKSGVGRGWRRWGGGEAGRGETRLDAARKQQAPLGCSGRTTASGDAGLCGPTRTENLEGSSARSPWSSANSTSRHEANDNTGSGGSTEGGWESSAACLGTREQLTLLYHAALTRYSHVENGWREDTHESRPSSTDPQQAYGTQEERRETPKDKPEKECEEPPPDGQVALPSEREELHQPPHSSVSICEDQRLIDAAIVAGDVFEPSLETRSFEDQERASHPLCGASESFPGSDHSEECSPHTDDPPSESVQCQSENCYQNVKLECSVSPEASPCQGGDTPGREATSPQGPDTSPVHPLLSPAWAASDTACKTVSRRDCAAPALTSPHHNTAEAVVSDDGEQSCDGSEEEECSGQSVRLSCLPPVPSYEERSDPAEGGQSDSQSDADNSESDSDSSVDYDIPPVDDRIYDPQFDPYFYQGSISLDDVPDDQPIDYPCPYDANGDYLCARQFTPHFSYLDHWSGSVVTAPGDLYRSQSQPEAVTQDQPLDGNAPLHAFLSQPIPTQVPPDFSLENSLLRPRKQGQFSSLCSFGGSQLYTITEEVEYDDSYDDFYSRRNYSESNLYFRGAEDLLPDPHFIRADLYYGDTDSDSTVHSESSDNSTETLDQDAHSLEVPEPNPTLHTSQISLADSIVLEAVAERDSSEELDAAGSEESLQADSVARRSSPHPGSECLGTEYPDEFFLFCSEAEVTGVDVMESVDVLPCNGSKEDFTYFKVESKTADRNSPVDHDFLLESYSCGTTMSGSASSPTTALGFHNDWEARVNGASDARKGPSSHVYQNIPLNSRLSKSNPDLALGDDVVDQGRGTTRPIYQNVPVPAKRHHTPGRDPGRGLDNLRSRDSNSNYYDEWTRGSGLHATSPYMNVPYNGHGSDTSLHNLNMKSSSSLSSSLSDGLDRVVSNGHSEEQRSSSGSLHDDHRTSPDLRYVGRSLAPPSRAFRGGSVGESSSGSFTAYASNTSLDHDTFSKTSKIYKWNGSSSVSDLTSLSRDLSNTSAGLSRGSASACDLTQVGGDEEWGNEAPLGETSYAAWCAKVQNDDTDDQDFMTSLGQRDTSPFVFTPHQKAAKRAMMELYVNNLSSDTDSDASTSSTSTSTSSSDDDGEDDGRSYQVTAPGEVGLATIEEDAEEDSGAESSGHWMFSADNTDTDSVIHVPAILTPAPLEHPQRRPQEDGESTASDETLVVEDDEEGVCGDSEGRGGRQEAGVTVSNSLARIPATTPTAGGHYDSSASEDEHGSQGTERPAGGSSLRAVHRRRRKPGDGRPAGSGADHHKANMLGPTHATRIFEKHVDDVFDFESLESCESVSGGSEASSPGYPGSLSGLEEPDVVFNMSATSQPFADVSPTLTGAASRKTTASESAELTGEPEDCEGSAVPSQILCGETAMLSLSSTPSVAPAGVCREETGGDLNNVISSSDTDLVLSSIRSDGPQPHEGSSGPQSMDMFGLPVRWTPGHDPRYAAADTTAATAKNNKTYTEAEKSSVMQMRSDCDAETFATTTARPSNSSSSLSEGRGPEVTTPCEAGFSPPPEVGQDVSSDSVQLGSAAEATACEAQQQETVSAVAFTAHGAGENSSEARHCHSPHGPAHHHHTSLAPLPQQSDGETPLLPPSGALNQDVNEDAMRDALPPPLLRGSTATKAAVGGVICEQVIPDAPGNKLADLCPSREAGYISRLRPQPPHSETCGADLPSGDSDTDTDNTDGDYDEEDHFAAELSLRISSVPATTTTKVKSFRSSDILNLIGLERGGAGPKEAGGASDDVSPPASQTGSSPEVPDSLRSSEGRSATRSVETLSEDSGLGDRDVRLTPSSPLAPISEAAPSEVLVTPSDAPVNPRPRRQDARQARIARARSCGDLRGYSDSDSEEEGAMYGWPPHAAAHPLTEGINGNSFSNRPQQRPYKTSYTNYLLQQQQQRSGDDRTSRHPHRPLPFSGSEGSDEDLRSRFTSHRVIPSGNSKPRRHKSFHEASRQDSTCWPAAAAGKGTWAAHGAPRTGRRRPQPISVDLAEQFLTQEGLKSPQRKQTVEDPYSAAGEAQREEWRMQHPPSLPGTGGVAYQAARAAPANQKPPCETSTNGVCVGSVGSGSEQCPPASSLTPELTVLRAWPAAQAAPSLLSTPSRPAPDPPSTRPPALAPLPHQYSSTPAQLPNECQPVHTGRSSSSPTHDPPGTTDSELCAASDLNEQCLPGGTGASPAAPDGVTTEMEEGPMKVHTKTYGSHGEVEVYLAKCDNGCRPPNTSPVLTPRGGGDQRPGSRGVTFSPSVKEINWRESYYEAEAEGEDSGSDVRKVLVMTSESPTLQRVDLTPSPPPPHTPTTTHSQDANNTPESRPTAPGGPVTDSDKSNGRVSQAPIGSSSDAEMSGDKSPRVQTPLWQRFKLPKISSPKSPRPKIPPKPQSLSSRSSDTESSKLSSPGMESSSSTPSSPDTKAKKTPSSPRFFSWGSKREKKVRVLPPRPLVSPPPPPPQVNAGQKGEGSGVQGGVKGEPDPAAAVSPAVLPREDRPGGASDIRSETVRQEVQCVSAAPREQRVTTSPARLVSADKPLIADSDGLSHESGRSPLTSATSGEDSSDAGQQPSPRSALSKPPLPPHLQRPNQQVFHKARLLSARRQYFSQERQVSAPERSSPPKEVRPPPPPKPREAPQPISASRYNSTFDASTNLKERFERFSASARAERERLARSTPDLSVIEASVRRQGPRIDLWSQCEQQQQQQSESHPASPASASDGDAARTDLAHRGASSTHQKARAAIHERYKNRAQRIHARARTQNSGVLETDLDTGASREVLTLRETNLDDLYRDLQHLLESIPSVGAAPAQADKARAKSLLDLEATAAMEAQLDTPARPPDTRAKSMEFLLDDGNKAAIQPPENELMKGSERQLSEAELRVRRSLQRLDVPDWMKNAPPPQQGFLLRRRDYGSSSAPGGGWSAYSSKTASMTSLGSSRAVTPNTPTKVVIPTRVATRGVGGIGGVTSPASNCSISPSPSDRSGSLFQYPISRWSTSRLNSGTTTPTGSVTSSRTTTTYSRQPYLGWRSQTSLANLAGSQSSLTSTGSYLTAADRLALGITAYSQRFVKTTPSTQDKENSSSEANTAAPKPENPEQNDTGSTNGSIKLQVPTDVADVHSSIKEVTSAIVHYCNESTPSPRGSPRGSPRPDGRAPSPRRLVWVESSFVGSRPITSPETPTSSTHAITPTSQLNGHDLPETGEVPSRPPQPPGEYLLAW